MKRISGRAAPRKAVRQDSAPLPAPGLRLVPSVPPDFGIARKSATPSDGIAPATARSGEDPRRKITYFWDEASFTTHGQLRILGWAFCELGLTEVVVDLDGEVVGNAELALPRPDVGGAFPLNPAAGFSGFRFEQQIPGLSAGEHHIGLVLRSALDEERSPGKRIFAPVQAAATATNALAASADLAEFRFQLDSPQVVSGVVIGPITERLTIEGWVVARSGVAEINVSLDDILLGEAHYGLARQDVGSALPDWDNALRSGYAFHCPPRALNNGAHLITLTVRARNGQELIDRFRIEVKKSADVDELFSIRRRIPEVEVAILAAALDQMSHRSNFHLLLRQPAMIVPDLLRTTLDSLRSQAYDGWRLTVLMDHPGARPAINELLADYQLAARVAVVDPAEPGVDPISAAAHGAGTLYGALCPGDRLGCDALAEIALASALHPEADFFYADEVRLNPASQRREPFFKPDFSPDLLLSTNYIGRPWFATAALLGRCGQVLRALFTCGEYDLLLRCTEQAAAVRHVPKLLAERGPETLDDDVQSRTALARAARRRRTAATVLPGCIPGTFRLKRTKHASGKVSIIIPTCGVNGLIETCLRTYGPRQRTAITRSFASTTSGKARRPGRSG